MTFNKLALQSGDSLHLYDSFYLKHPTLTDIKELKGNEALSLHEESDKYIEYTSILSTSLVDIADILWVENKVWYEDIKSEWLFFIQQCLLEAVEVLAYDELEDGRKSVPRNCVLINSRISDSLAFFVDVSPAFVIQIDKETNSITLLNVSKDERGMYKHKYNDFVFNEAFYMITRDFIQKINWRDTVEHNVVKGGTKRAKKYILEMEYKGRMDDLKHHREPTVTLDSITSSLVAKGISYSELWKMPIYMIYNLYYRFMQFTNWDGTTHALYSGCLDTKKNPINWEQINWSKIID